MNHSYEITKRAFDFAAALVGLALSSPALLVIYLAVVLTSRGPGLFVQRRAGKDGRLFPLVKFRTMRTDHVHDPDPAIVIADDHAGVTAIGRFLRKSKLDEMPSLVNVLAGHMSLVGPRPTVPEQATAYDDFRRRRLAVRPGLTGLAIINGGTRLTWDERIEWDVYYVEHRCWRMDLRILLRTLSTLLTGTEKRVMKFSDWRNP